METETERLFVALTLPIPVRDTLVALAEPLPGVNWTTPKQLHLITPLSRRRPGATTRNDDRPALGRACRALHPARRRTGYFSTQTPAAHHFGWRGQGPPAPLSTPPTARRRAPRVQAGTGCPHFSPACDPGSLPRGGRPGLSRAGSASIALSMRHPFGRKASSSTSARGSREVPCIH